ncbi:putative oxalocrotonate tautomerase [Podospora australis]|uniref:Oxalocrotonate tautomerase n=1 Tax=Podospora australis TaxID=1536484 RepID=A0AAN6WNY5_9PEZI|nr:putative oxalocrotonate tautomerase [Podospora australis]
MPLWLVFHPEGTFSTPQEKQALAADITTIYTSAGLPAFYVVMNFIQLPPSSIYVGGEQTREKKPFIRFVAEHIAVHFEDNKARQDRVLQKIDQLLKPHVADKGYDWEYHIDETPRGLWKIQGLVPPPFQSQAEKKWFEANKALEWEGEDGEVGARI